MEDFTQIDRKRLEFVFNTNIIAMCALSSVLWLAIADTLLLCPVACKS